MPGVDPSGHICSCCGERRSGGVRGRYDDQDWYVCSKCGIQGVETPPLPQAIVDDLNATLARHVERQYRDEHGVSVTVTWKPKDPTKRATWAEVVEREGGIAEAIRAIHAAKIDAGLARPLTRLLDIGEVAEAYGVTRPTLRRWLRGGKLGHLTQIKPAGGGLYFREDEVERDTAEEGKS